MIWIEVDDIEIIRAVKEKKYKILKDAILRNTQNQYVELDGLFEGDRTTIFEPTDDEVRKMIIDASKVIIFAFRSPADTFLGVEHPFLHLFARNPHFPQKTIEFIHKVPREKTISEKLGFRLVKPKYGLDSIAGNFKLKKYLQKIKYLRDIGLPSTLSALMFFGTAGSGKTHVAEAIAFDFGYNFGYLDLPHFMTLPSPTRALDELFDFLQEQDNKCLLLIDEIEKMFDFTGRDLKSQNVFGKLLTRLNDIYNDPKNNIIFIATANNIAPIIKNNPEFLRKGRFDEVFFLSYPNKPSAFAMLELFTKKVKTSTVDVLSDLFSSLFKQEKEETTTTEINIVLKSIQSMLKENGSSTEDIEKIIKKLSISLDVEHLYDIIEEAYPDVVKVCDDDEFIYAPPEIATVIKELQSEAIYRAFLSIEEVLKEKENITHEDIPDINKMLLENDGEMIENVIKTIVPLQIYASEGIKKQIAQAENYSSSIGVRHENYKKG